VLGLSSTAFDSVSTASDLNFEWFIEVISETSLVSSTLRVDRDNLLSSMILPVDKDFLLPLSPGDGVADGGLLLLLLSCRSKEKSSEETHLLNIGKFPLSSGKIDCLFLLLFTQDSPAQSTVLRLCASSSYSPS
jgi:hypothetical protein